MDRLWRIELFGALRAKQISGDMDEGHRAVVTHFRSRKVASLLAYLAYHLPHAYPRDQLVAQFWPEAEPPDGHTSLRQAIALLRHQLEPQRVDSSELRVESWDGLASPGLSTLNSQLSTVILADRASVRLNPTAVTTDVAEFEAALRSAASLDGAAPPPSARTRAEWLARAVALYHDSLLPGWQDEWVVPAREWLAERYFQALGLLIAHLEQAGDLNAALEYACRGVAADPLREETHAELIRLYAAAGRPRAALRSYRELERLLEKELGTTPSAVTRTLVGEIEALAGIRRSGVPAFRRSGLRQLAAERLASPGEKHLVTVLYARVDGPHSTGIPAAGRHQSDSGDLSSRLPSTDAQPAESVRGLSGMMTDILTQYGGQVEGCLEGIVAVFGALQAHEDDAERAIRAALEARKVAQRLGLDFSAGVDTGEAHVGAAENGELRIVGPALHRAERLQAQARPGEILTGTATYRLTRRAFLFTPQAGGTSTIDRPAPLSAHLIPLSSTSCAGTCHPFTSAAAQPLPVYVVERALPRAQKARGLDGLRARLIGRDEELAKLRQVLTDVLEGRGQIVTLIGEAGVGKSRLIAELRQALGVRRWALGTGAEDVPSPAPNAQRLTPLWLEGRCSELRQGAGYSLFAELLRDYFARQPEADGCRRMARLVASLEELGAAGALPTERIAEIGPLLGHLLSLRGGNEWDARLKNAPPEQLRHQTFLAVRDFFVALARLQPLVLVGEDLHWADSLSLDLLSLLMESLPAAPLLVLCVYRPELEHKSRHLATIAAQKCPECHTELHLHDLPPPQGRALIESLLTGENLPASLKELLLGRSSGNPFFTEELVRSLIDAGMVYRQGKTWQVRKRTRTITIPETIQSVILSRVDRLEPELKRVLQSASVIGRHFPRRLLESMTPAAVNLERALWELEERALIYQERAVPEEEYSFKHVLTRETVYQNLLQRQRAILHQQAAEAIEALYRENLDAHFEPLAHHYEQSGADEKAVEYLVKAGEKSRRAYLNDAAASYFRRALARLEDEVESSDRWRLPALMGLGQIDAGTGKLPEAEGYLRRAIAAAQELRPRERVRLYWWLAEALFWQDRFDEAIRIAEEGLSLLAGDTRSPEAALMNDRLAWCYHAKEDRKRWEELNDGNARLLEQLPYSEELRPAYINQFEMHYEAGSLEEGEKWLHALEQRSQPLQDVRALGEVRVWEGTLAVDRGDLRGAIQRLQQSLELLAKTGDAKLETWSRIKLGEALLSLGDLPGAREHLQQGLEIARAVGNQWRIAWACETLGTVALCEGASEEAVRLFQEADDRCRDSGFERVTPGVYLARAYLLQSERQAALRLLPAAVARARDQRCILASALSALEAAYESPAEFRAFCRRFRKEHPDLDALPFVRWCLEPGQPDCGFRILDFGFAPETPAIQNPKSTIHNREWVWHDPFGDGSFTLENRLVIQAANGRDLWELNRSAPRLLRPVPGDFAIETACAPVSSERPAIGGLLLWQDCRNFLRLERGTRGPDEISFQGCIGGQDVIIGRGCFGCRLPAPGCRLSASGKHDASADPAGAESSQPQHRSRRTGAESREPGAGSPPMRLRLERHGSRVQAFGSADGEQWWTAGSAALPLEGPLQVGLHAIGRIDRTVYAGTYPEGTAVGFEYFRLWR